MIGSGALADIGTVTITRNSNTKADATSKLTGGHNSWTLTITNAADGTTPTAFTPATLAKAINGTTHGVTGTDKDEADKLVAALKKVVVLDDTAAGSDGTAFATITLTGQAPAVATNNLRNIVSYVGYNGKYAAPSTGNINLYSGAISGTTAPKTFVGADTQFTVTSVNWAATPLVYCKDDTSNDSAFAKTGRYDVTYAYEEYNTTTKKYDAVKKSNGFSVTNTLDVPTVTVGKRELSSVSEDEIINVLKTNVDLNNNDSEHASITNLYEKYTGNTATPATYTGGKSTVKYVAVKENRNWDAGTQITFLVNINSAVFKEV
jgi:hypothetical protein